LSGGEKAAFDLLLDLHVKKKFFTDAIYCIDEIEAHLHTRVQGALIREMVNILPAASQLWVTTHSLGALRAAQEMAASTRIAPAVVVVCEGSSIGTRRKDFDAEIYNRILGARFPDVVFVSGGSAQQIEITGSSVHEILRRLLPKAKVWSLSDRDDRSDAEVAEREQRGVITLPQRNLETFLFADDVIEALVRREQKPDTLNEALDIKRGALANSGARGNRTDDLKSAAGEIYVELKKLVGLQRCGNSTDAFMRDTLAPLIEPSMPSYQALKAAIIDRVL
jgi:hypothetical protein